MSGISGVAAVSSTSYQNASSLQIEFEYGTDMDNAEDEVKDALDNVNLPSETMDPDVGRISINAFPILAISISDKESNLEELTKKVVDSLVPSIESIEGVSSAAISGQQIEEISLTFDEEKMGSLGLDEETVKMIIKGSNVTMPLGLFEFDNEEQSVVVDGNVTTIEDLKNILIPAVPANASGQAGMQVDAPIVAEGIEMPTVKLGEIATIELVGNAESVSRTNGKEAIAIQITKS